MAVTADVVKVVLEGDVDGYNADIKSSVGVFEGSMTKMERAAVRTEKTVTSAMTRSAKLTSSQLQTIQYTVNDVIASLSSGGNPLTILAQQGGQVTQAFGGLTGTLKALAPFAFSAGGALTAVGVALGAAIIAADKADGEFQDLQNSVTGLGRAAGLSAQGLRDIAENAAAAGKVGRAAAEGMAIAYANTGRIGGQVIGDLISITDDYARATGVDAKKATEALGAAFADPTKGAQLLQAQFGLLDAKTMELIKSMQASGDTAGAQALLFDRLSVAIADQSEKVSGLTKFTNWLADGWRNAAAQARDYAKAQIQADRLAQARALGGVPTPAGEESREANRAAFRRGSRARANQRATAAQDIINSATGDDQRAAIRAKIAQINRSLAEGGVDAKQASAAIKKLTDDLAAVGRAPKAVRGGGRAAVTASGPSVRGVADAVVDPSTIVDLTRIRPISSPGTDPTFQAAGAASGQASDALEAYRSEVYDQTFYAISDGLEAGFRDGLPGVLQYFSQELQRSLIASLAKSLTDLISQAGTGGGGGGNIFSAVSSVLFGRANGGSMVGGRPYMINEGQPEVFVPPVSGKMVPVGKLGGGRGGVVQQFNVSFDGAVMTAELVAGFNALVQKSRVQATTDGARLGHQKTMSTLQVSAKSKLGVG